MLAELARAVAGFVPLSLYSLPLGTSAARRVAPTVCAPAVPKVQASRPVAGREESDLR